MVKSDVTEVNVESPAARSADGIIKLGDHKIGWAMAEMSTRIKIVPMILSGGLNSLINNG